MPSTPDRLSLKVLHLIEGEAEGRFAIGILAVLVLAVVVLAAMMRIVLA
jgi:hypothetical protein